MIQELYKQLIALALGGIIGVALKYWYDYKGMVHKELWGKRYESYKKLFSVTGLLPQYPQRSGVTYADLLRTSEKMRDWFFDDGGLLLSVKTRNKYFKVQKEIHAVIKDKPKEKTIEEDYEHVRLLFSQLRRQLADDLMSRRRA